MAARAPPRERAAMRLALNAGDVRFLDACRGEGLRLATDRVHYFSHWITPPGAVRFDTRFFLSRVPRCQDASLAGNEMSELVWHTAAEALAEYARGRLLLMFPTRAILKDIAEFRDFDALFDFANRPRNIVPITPVLPRGVQPQRS